MEFFAPRRLRFRVVGLRASATRCEVWQQEAKLTAKDCQNENEWGSTK